MSHPNIATTAELYEWTAALGGSTLRTTGSEAHEEVLDELIERFAALSTVQVRTEYVDLLRWTPAPAGDLERAGSLCVDVDGGTSVDIAGVVPYSAPTGEKPVRAPLTFVPAGDDLGAHPVRGRIVVRDVVPPLISMSSILAGSLHASDDVTDPERESTYARPFLAPLADDLLTAMRLGAAGMIFVFPVKRASVAGYFDPHTGTHFTIPAVFTGVEDRELLLGAARTDTAAQISINARVTPGQTRNVFATLPGVSDQKIVIVSHADGATWVQENGPAALLALAQYFSSFPESARPYSLEFAVTTGHLHMSKEGSDRYAAEIDTNFEASGVLAVIAVEHLGARELVPADDGSLQFTKFGEVLLWAVGPSEAMRTATVAAVQSRGLDGVVVGQGFGVPLRDRVPEYGSFGGIGSYYHTRLIPTMALVSGPWSLWAPAFGADAIDFERMRLQIIAVADVVTALLRTDESDIAGGYRDYRRARDRGSLGQVAPLPPEVMTDPGIPPSWATSERETTTAKGGCSNEHTD